MGNIINVASGSASITVIGSEAVETTDVKAVDGEYLLPASFLIEALGQYMEIDWDKLLLLVDVTADTPVEVNDWSDTYPNAITVKNAVADYVDNEAKPIWRALDGDITTEWSFKGNNGEYGDAWGIFDFGALYDLDEIMIAFHQANKRTISFAVEVSADGQNFTTLIEKRVHVDSGTADGLGLKTYEIADDAVAGGVRYVKFLGYGSDLVPSYNSPTEIIFIGTAIPNNETTPEPTPTPGAEPTPAPSEEPTSTPNDTPDDDDEELVTDDAAETTVDDVTATAAPTGDDSNVLLWSVLSLFAFAGVAIGIRRRKFKKM